MTETREETAPPRPEEFLARLRATAATIVATMRYMSYLEVPDNSDVLSYTAGKVEEWAATYDGTHLGCCPVCEEITCDDGCPLEAIRAAAQLDRAAVTSPSSTLPDGKATA